MADQEQTALTAPAELPAEILSEICVTQTCAHDNFLLSSRLGRLLDTSSGIFDLFVGEETQLVTPDAIQFF